MSRTIDGEPVTIVGAVGADSLRLAAISSQIITSTLSTHPTTITIPTKAQTTTITIPDPGAATASVVLTKGTTTMEGKLTLSTIPASLDVVTMPGGELGASFPSTPSIPLDGY